MQEHEWWALARAAVGDAVASDHQVLRLNHRPARPDNITTHRSTVPNVTPRLFARRAA
jgi:hypothetical protein